MDPIATLARGNKEGFTYVFPSGDQIVKNKIFQKVKTLTEEGKRGRRGQAILNFKFFFKNVKSSALRLEEKWGEGPC